MTLLLALGALTLVLGTWIAYLSTIPRGKVPQNPHLYTTVLLVGAGVASAALWLRTGSGLHRAGVYAAAGLSLVLVATWLVLMARRKTPASTLKVKVGDPVLPFVTAQSDGTSFDLASLRGQRYLFNFFRGSWCPYCSAELKRFEEIRPELESRGVHVIALSKDDVASAATHAARDGLGFPLLSDPELKVIRQYGVEHHKAIEFSTGSFTAFGVTLALVPSVKTMAAPTTLLVDEEGIVRWIDQPTDYRLRSSEQKVLSAVDETFGSPAENRSASS